MPRKPKYPELKSVRKVSERDRLIFQQVSIQNRSQRELAAEHQISQTQVSRIVRRVYRWMCDTAPCGLEEVPRPQRLYGVARIYKEKLEYFEREADEAWQNSKREISWTRTQDVIEQPDGKTTLSPGKITRKSPKPDIKYLNAAKGYAQALVEFEGFEKNGAVARDNNDRLHEVPEIRPEKDRDVLIEVGQRLQAERDAERAEAARENSNASEPKFERGSPEERTIRGMQEHGLEAPIFATPFTPPAPAYHPPVEQGSADSPKTHSTRENVVPNDFETGGSNRLAAASGHPGRVAAGGDSRRGELASASGRSSAPSYVGRSTAPSSSGYTPYISPNAGVIHPEHQRSRAEGVGRIFGTTSSGQGNIERPEKAEGPEPKKIYPPAPPGYVRLGEYCRPKQLMIMSDPVDCTKLRPFQNNTPPKYYVLDEKNKEWLAVW